MKICICSSMAFYDRFATVVHYLEKAGHVVSFPTLEGDDKPDAMRKHFQKIESADAILVLNYEKHGVANYIGANVFLEIGYAFARDKKIFLLHDLPSSSPFVEELEAMEPTCLHGDVTAVGTSSAR